MCDITTEHSKCKMLTTVECLLLHLWMIFVQAERHYAIKSAEKSVPVCLIKPPFHGSDIWNHKRNVVNVFKTQGPAEFRNLKPYVVCKGTTTGLVGLSIPWNLVFLMTNLFKSQLLLYLHSYLDMRNAVFIYTYKQARNTTLNSVWNLLFTMCC